MILDELNNTWSERLNKKNEIELTQEEYKDYHDLLMPPERIYIESNGTKGLEYKGFKCIIV